MKKFLPVTIIAISLIIPTMTFASEERHDHFKGKPSDTIDQALANFSEHNKQLAGILAKDSLSPRDIADIHKLTYTLENALKKMNTDFSALADTLENVHKASETTDGEKVKARGLQYLKATPKALK